MRPHTEVAHVTIIARAWLTVDLPDLWCAEQLPKRLVKGYQCKVWNEMCPRMMWGHSQSLSWGHWGRALMEAQQLSC